LLLGLNRSKKLFITSDLLYMRSEKILREPANVKQVSVSAFKECFENQLK